MAFLRKQTSEGSIAELYSVDGQIYEVSPENKDKFLNDFPNAELYGIDLFVREKMRAVPAFKKDRVHFMKGDSTNPIIGPMVLENFGKIKFDIIIDDGMHTPKANMQTYNNLLPFLKQGGQYFIEDVWPLEILTQQEMGHPWIQQHPDRYNTLDHEMFLGAIDRSKLKAQRFDLRKESKQPDSYIMRMP